MEAIKIIERLEKLEDFGLMLLQETTRLKKQIAEGVSTPPKKSKLTPEQIAKITAGCMRSVLKQRA